jgi:hypothetical protein
MLSSCLNESPDQHVYHQRNTECVIHDSSESSLSRRVTADSHAESRRKGSAITPSHHDSQWAASVGLKFFMSRPGTRWDLHFRNHKSPDCRRIVAGAVQLQARIFSFQVEPPGPASSSCNDSCAVQVQSSLIAATAPELPGSNHTTQ